MKSLQAFSSIGKSFRLKTVKNYIIIEQKKKKVRLIMDFKLYRRRFIPDETIFLKDDVIVYMDDEKIVTKWNVLKPRSDFAKGMSCYYLKEGYKVSKFVDYSGDLVYYYCDIIDTSFDANGKKYIFSDLLVDVIVYEDGRVKVVDLGEIAEALEKGLISIDIAKNTLIQLDNLLNIIYELGIESLITKEMEI